MNNQPLEPMEPISPHGEVTASPADDPTAKAVRRYRYISRKACLIIIFASIPVLLWLEIARPVLSHDPILAPLISMTFTRSIGALVFFTLLLGEGYHVLNPIRKPFLKSLLFIIPPLLVVVNNMPILSMIRGDAYLVHKAPVYLIWFAAECLAIGLFEELAFRGTIFLLFAEKRHTTRKGLFLSLILTSAVFGVVHLVNLFMGAGVGSVILQVGYSFLIGAMCSVVLLKTHNIWLCVLLHAIYDFSGTLIPTLGAGTWWDTPTVIFTAALAVATTAYLVWHFFRLNIREVEKIYRGN